MATVRGRGNFPPQQRQPPSQNDNTTVIGQDGKLKIAAVVPTATAPGNERRTKSGRFTMAQLRQTDGLVPLQSGTNQFDSQRQKTPFGAIRNTTTKVEFADDGKRYQVEDLTTKDNLIRLQSGTNRFSSQKGTVAFGTPRDVKGKHLKRIWELEFPEEEIQEQPVNYQQQNNGDVYSPRQQFQPQSPRSPAQPQRFQAAPQRPQQQQAPQFR
ncbi:Calponin family repeat-containing domain protein [Aphelenchoides besseyi]|nr:Calponin family repeat-containing domain protein [Aphelenchoides besseyi]KAI6207754.1 Calponin family repeat-containing domain protein [Aphelenchoides besseyi]